jgi:hypothetical protein
MKDHIETYHSTLDSLLKTYRGKTAPDKLERAAYASAQSKPDFYGKPEEERKRLVEAEARKQSAEHQADLLLDIEDAQNKLKKQLSKEHYRIDRLQVRAATGQDLVKEYANANGLLDSEAQAELNSYAQVKTSGFGDSLADRYAALRHRSQLRDLDRKKAEEIYKKEEDRLQILDARKNLKDAEYWASQHPTQVMDAIQKGGYALLRQFKEQIKE